MRLRIVLPFIASLLLGQWLDRVGFDDDIDAADPNLTLSFDASDKGIPRPQMGEPQTPDQYGDFDQRPA